MVFWQKHNGAFVEIVPIPPHAVQTAGAHHGYERVVQGAGSKRSQLPPRPKWYAIRARRAVLGVTNGFLKTLERNYLARGVSPVGRGDVRSLVREPFLS